MRIFLIWLHRESNLRCAEIGLQERPRLMVGPYSELDGAVGRFGAFGAVRVGRWARLVGRTSRVLPAAARSSGRGFDGRWSLHAGRADEEDIGCVRPTPRAAAVGSAR